MATKVFTFQARALDGLTNESGALTYVVRKGTTTPIIAYTDSGLTTPATNPQVANSLGLVGPLYWNDSVEAEVTFRVKTNDAATVLLQVDYAGGAFSASYIQVGQLTKFNATYTSDGAQTKALTGKVVSSPYGLNVYFDGIIQPKDNYTVTTDGTDSTITWATSCQPTSGVTVYYEAAVLQALSPAATDYSVIDISAAKVTPTAATEDSLANWLAAKVTASGGDASATVVTPVGAPNELTLAYIAGERVSFAAWEPAADGTADDAAKFSAFLTAIHDNKVKGYVPAGDYAISFVEDRTFTNDIDIEFHPEALIIGKLTRQDFAGDDVTTSCVVTAWAKHGDFRVVRIQAGGTQTVLTENTEFTVSGQTVNLAAGSMPYGAIPTGETIRVVDSDPMINIGAASLNGCGVQWIGGFFDVSERGFADSIDSGSAVIFQDFRKVLARDGHYYAADDYETAKAEGRGDTGIVTISCSNVEISGNIFEGLPDLGIYGTGDNDSGPSDDGFQFSVHSNWFEKCSGGVSNKRAGQGTSIRGNTFNYAYIGASLWPAGGNAVGARGVISGNTFWRTGRTAVDCRNSNAPIISDNRIIDFGKKLDGTTTIADTPCALKFLGCTDGIMHDNVIKLSDWVKDTQVGIQVGKEVTFSSNESTNCKVHHNKVSGLAVACLESNAGTGNVWRENDLLSNDADMSVISGRRWHYRKSNIEYEGIGSTAFEGTFTPTVVFAGASPTITYVNQQGRYIRRGTTVTEFVKIQFSYSGTVSSNQLRIASSPYTSMNTSGQDATGSLGYWDAALTPPANTVQIVPKRTANSTQVRFDVLRSTGGPAIITTDDIAASTNLRIEYTITYEVNSEAQN